MRFEHSCVMRAITLQDWAQLWWRHEYFKSIIQHKSLNSRLMQSVNPLRKQSVYPLRNNGMCIATIAPITTTHCPDAKIMTTAQRPTTNVAAIAQFSATTTGATFATTHCPTTNRSIT